MKQNSDRQYAEMPQSVRISVRQKDRLVEILDEEYLSLQGRYANGSSMVSRREEWCKITAELNLLGPAKSESEWRACWWSLKTAVRITKTESNRQDLIRIRPTDSNGGHPVSYDAAEPSSVPQVTRTLSPKRCHPGTAIHPSTPQKLDKPSSLFSTKYRRNRMMNQAQKAYIVKAFDTNVEMFEFRNVLFPINFHAFWAKMANFLNELGPPKTTFAWKKAWQEMKSKAIYRCTHRVGTCDELDLSILRISKKHDGEEAQRKDRRVEKLLSSHALPNSLKCAEVFRTIQGGYLFSCDHCSALINAFDELIVHLNEHLEKSLYNQNTNFAPSSVSMQSLFCKTTPSTDTKSIPRHRIKPTNDLTMSGNRFAESVPHQAPTKLTNFAKFTPFKEPIKITNKPAFSATSENVTKLYIKDPLENIHDPNVLHINIDHMPIYEEEKFLIFEDDFSTSDPLFGTIEKHDDGGDECTMDTSIQNDVERDPTLLPDLQCDNNKEVDRNSIPCKESLEIKCSSPSSSKLKCEKCAPGLTFDTKEELSLFCNHVLTKCPYGNCKKSYRSKNALERHIVFFHIETQCEQCSRKCASLNLLQRHELTHDKKLECDICHNFFANMTSIRTHMISHSNTKRFECLECGERFKYRTAYADHKKMHMGVEREKRCVCEHCGKAYAYNSQLRDHLKTHTEVRDHPCMICGKAFRTSKYLLVHTKRLHTDEKPWKCRYCPMTFRNGDTRKRHEIKVHSKL